MNALRHTQVIQDTTESPIWKKNTYQDFSLHTLCDTEEITVPFFPNLFQWNLIISLIISTAQISFCQTICDYFVFQSHVLIDNLGIH